MHASRTDHACSPAVNSGFVRRRATTTLASIAFSLLLAQVSSAAPNCDRYADPVGDGDGLTSGTPYQIVDFWTDTPAGKTLCLLSGTYTGADSMIVPNVSGTLGNEIRIVAQDDGGPVIDGQGIYNPINLQNGASYIEIEGVHAKNGREANGAGHVVRVDNAHHITMRRVTAQDAWSSAALPPIPPDEEGTPAKINNMPFGFAQCHDILLEDVAGWGTGQKVYNFQTCHHVTVRRCWGRLGSNSDEATVDNSLTLYGSDDSIVENCVFVSEDLGRYPSGVDIWANDFNDSADRNLVVGNITRDGIVIWGFTIGAKIDLIKDNSFRHNVTIGNDHAYRMAGGVNSLFEYNTAINASLTSMKSRVTDPGGLQRDPDYHVDGDWKYNNTWNASPGPTGIWTTGLTALLGPVNALNNNVYNHSPAYFQLTSETGGTAINCAWQTLTYGDGAYLMRTSNCPDVGAEVLYRYVKGVPTTDRLWPWPMEDRIFAETGASVTWADDGGLWETLAGVYSDQDSDGVDDRFDNCLVVHNPSQYDADLDGYGNVCDGDFDQNGVVNFSDSLILWDNLGYDVPPSDPVTDMNGDGKVNGTSVPPETNDYDFYFATFNDTEGSGLFQSGLACADAQSDGSDPCAAPAGDHDGDGVTYSLDNCVYVANTSQYDADFDGYGNACDGDFDQSGIVNFFDSLILWDNLGYDVPPSDPVTDMNGDGKVNGASVPPETNDFDFYFDTFNDTEGSGLFQSGLSCAAATSMAEPCAP